MYVDDGAAEIAKEFKSGKLTLGVDDIRAAAASDLTGATIDENGVIVSASEDGGTPVAVGFRAKKSNGKYKYFWLYRVRFGIPATALATKGDNITFSTPTIEGTILRRNKVDTAGKHAEVAEWLRIFQQHMETGDIMNADDGLIVKALVEEIIVGDESIEIRFKCGASIEQAYEK